MQKKPRDVPGAAGTVVAASLRPGTARAPAPSCWRLSDASRTSELDPLPWGRQRISVIQAVTLEADTLGFVPRSVA